jgi:hypothetical protein
MQRAATTGLRSTAPHARFGFSSSRMAVLNIPSFCGAWGFHGWLGRRRCCRSHRGRRTRLTCVDELRFVCWPACWRHWGWLEAANASTGLTGDPKGQTSSKQNCSNGECRIKVYCESESASLGLALRRDNRFNVAISRNTSRAGRAGLPTTTAPPSIVDITPDCAPTRAFVPIRM